MSKELVTYTAMRRVQFCCGHRVHLHESKCAHPHGHNYVAWLHARATDLDSIGRVIDFSVLKQRVGGWIERAWDHGFVFYERDTLMARALGHGWKTFALPTNPTAENMAAYLLTVVGPMELGDTGVSLFKVELYETENCVATAELVDAGPNEGKVLTRVSDLAS